MFSENPANLIVAGKSSFAGCREAPIDSNKLCWCGLVLPISKASVDFKRDLRKLRLRLFRPGFHEFQYVFECLGGHVGIISQIVIFVRPFRECEGAFDQRSEAIHSFFTRRNGLLRGACHRARVRATRRLAMTSEYERSTNPAVIVRLDRTIQYSRGPST
jgi:hypothetical protein